MLLFEELYFNHACAHIRVMFLFEEADTARGPLGTARTMREAACSILVGTVASHPTALLCLNLTLLRLWAVVALYNEWLRYLPIAVQSAAVWLFPYDKRKCNLFYLIFASSISFKDSSNI